MFKKLRIFLFSTLLLVFAKEEIVVSDACSDEEEMEWRKEILDLRHEYLPHPRILLTTPFNCQLFTKVKSVCFGWQLWLWRLVQIWLVMHWDCTPGCQKGFGLTYALGTINAPFQSNPTPTNCGDPYVLYYYGWVDSLKAI